MTRCREGEVAVVMTSSRAEALMLLPDWARRLSAKGAVDFTETLEGIWRRDGEDLNGRSGSCCVIGRQARGGCSSPERWRVRARSRSTEPPPGSRVRDGCRGGPGG